jgi:hypothetical protein
MAPGITTKTRTVSTKLTTLKVADTPPHRSVDPSQAPGEVCRRLGAFRIRTVACPACLVSHMRHVPAVVVPRPAQFEVANGPIDRKPDGWTDLTACQLPATLFTIHLYGPCGPRSKHYFSRLSHEEAPT